MNRLLTAFLLLAAAVASPAAGETTLERLASFMVGRFSNADQAIGDQNFQEVSLHVARIWPDRNDGRWLYSEQALSEALDHPFRQRVFHLTERPDGTVEADIFELADPIPLTGAWQDPSRFDKIGPAELMAQTGCTWILQPQSDGSFQGGTVGRGCLSTLRGASYSTCETVIGARQSTTWDRGYNVNGVQVWGSIHGGYIFKRVE